MTDRVLGLLLFLPVPFVLFLFTRQPLGPWRSLGLGVALMLTHRLYARPFARGRARRRCLWCGGRSGEGPILEIEEPLGTTTWRTCGPAHAERLGGTLAWVGAHARLLAAGILGTLALFLGLAVAAALGRPPGLSQDDAVAVFRVGIAATVLPPAWGRGSTAGRAGRLPFPVHIQALVGTVAVLWLFRLVGLWWLAAGLLHAARRLG